ncbi:hypothetical protein CANARDRAFT_26860 [[Candida] arabinofermentans NRRL YB-2248]|uniref:CCHC-type domain-containing protein n=1 Tax=[Candida] arabinofermentans NRRL YB-2248 TaxID=983967 RepID=A0A1E4T6U7_9ASCO|nr:hypothetical protein CANARDRAFT_26860 [[Candida] arabinofermentans NRRL YB-2248]
MLFTSPLIIDDDEPQEVIDVKVVDEDDEDSSSASSDTQPKSTKNGASLLEEELEPPVEHKALTVISTQIGDINSDNNELAELRGEGRYFGVTDPETSQPICSNCHRRGHIRVHCKVVVCHACGKVDDHYETQCPKSMVCSNCGKRGHFRNLCTEKKKYNYCTDCESKNHSNDRCPNIWRSYITNSYNDNHVFAYPGNAIYCYNCARRGHYGDECVEYRTSKTPNINGSAFTGDNLPKELRSQYRKNLRNLSSESGSDYNSYGNSSSRTNFYEDGSNKRKRGNLYDEYASNDNGRKRSNYNTMPPPSKDRNGPISQRPTKSGFLPLGNPSKNQGYRKDNNSNKNSYDYKPQITRRDNLPSGPSVKKPTRSGFIDQQKSSGYQGNRGESKSYGGPRRGDNSDYNRRKYNNNKRY